MIYCDVSHCGQGEVTQLEKSQTPKAKATARNLKMITENDYAAHLARSARSNIDDSCVTTEWQRAVSALQNAKRGKQKLQRAPERNHD
jgi:hypothetical protein